jgi:hypothetical protein
VRSAKLAALKGSSWYAGAEKATWERERIAADAQKAADSRRVRLREAAAAPSATGFTVEQESEWARRVEFLENVGEQTKAHRERRARAYEVRAREVRLEARGAGLSAIEGAELARWYVSRAEGQRARIERVVACGKTDDLIVTSCEACGVVREMATSCGSRSLCRSCRGTRNQLTRARFLRARGSLLNDAAKACLVRGHRRWTEKLVTLTVPHYLGASERLRWMAVAVPHFLRALRGAWKQQQFDLRFVAYYRAYEWTAGEDGLGHPHVHLWMFCPWIGKERIASMWKDALLRAGFPERGFPASTGHMPVVDVAMLRAGDPAKIANEVIKYLTKDIIAHDRFVDPATYARVYEAFDGLRVTQGSRGFLARAGQVAARCACGAEGCFRVQHRKRAPNDDPSLAKVVRLADRAKKRSASTKGETS